MNWACAMVALRCRPPKFREIKSDATVEYNIPIWTQNHQNSREQTIKRILCTTQQWQQQKSDIWTKKQTSHTSKYGK
jgi:hypothetical protein